MVRGTRSLIFSLKMSKVMHCGEVINEKIIINMLIYLSDVFPKNMFSVKQTSVTSI